MTFKEILVLIIQNYGEIIVSVMFAILGIAVKKLVERYVHDLEKKEIIKDCVKSVEQVYKHLHGSDKLSKAMECATSILLEKGITITEVELTTLIESALAEFNRAFDMAGESTTNEIDNNCDTEGWEDVEEVSQITI